MDKSKAKKLTAASISLLAILLLSLPLGLSGFFGVSPSAAHFSFPSGAPGEIRMSISNVQDFDDNFHLAFEGELAAYSSTSNVSFPIGAKSFRRVAVFVKAPSDVSYSKNYTLNVVITSDGSTIAGTSETGSSVSAKPRLTAEYRVQFLPKAGETGKSQGFLPYVAPQFLLGGGLVVIVFAAGAILMFLLSRRG